MKGMIDMGIVGFRPSQITPNGRNNNLDPTNVVSTQTFLCGGMEHVEGTMRAGKISGRGYIEDNIDSLGWSSVQCGSTKRSGYDSIGMRSR